MRCRVSLFLLAGLALVLSNCSQTDPLSPGSQDLGGSDAGTMYGEDVASSLGADHVEYTYPYDLDSEDPWVFCNGELMQEHGILEVHIRETTTPSGNLVVHGWVDYDAYGGVTIEELSTGDTWSLLQGHNPFGEVIKENGFYLLHYQWHELFSDPDRGMLRLRVMGHVKIESDGTVSIDREDLVCF